jgi:alanyl-tRNA synthetase
VDENKFLLKKIDELNKEQLVSFGQALSKEVEKIQGIGFLAKQIDIEAKLAKDIVFQLTETYNNLFILLITTSGDKVTLTLMLSQELVKEKGLNAGNIIRELAKEVNGGGGGQPHFATAGGSNARGIEAAIRKAREIVSTVK